MRYSFYYYDGYSYKEKIVTRNLTLDNLFEFLTDNEERWIKFEEDENDKRKIIIWSESNIKQALMPENFDSYDLFLNYLVLYGKYGRKRFAEMPAIRIFRDNYEFLEQQWQEICKRKPKYLILREHDNGYADILEKNELSAEDIQIMNREHKIYQNYLKRWNEYVKIYPEKRYPVWRSDADNEFESDFALYDPIDEQGVD
ncbi:hypothetical protein HYV10_00055 [Candidatus Dependentiae bacterium]|nr:hypothetical protein [Candidatus Dependentiae bacterium]